MIRLDDKTAVLKSASIAETRRGKRGKAARTLQLIVNLYQSWDKSDQARPWQEKLDVLNLEYVKVPKTP